MGQMAKDEIQKALDSSVKAIVRHEEAIRKEEDRQVDLEKLLRYCECKKCGAELTGGIQDARDVYEACKLIRRQDVPCAVCDTNEQSKAMAKALELVVQ